MMKKRRLAGLLAFLMCAVFTFTACVSPIDIFMPWWVEYVTNGRPGRTPGGGTGGEPAAVGERRVIPFSQMEYTRPDVDAMAEKITELTESMKNAESYMELVLLANQSGPLFEEFSTMNVLANIKWNIDMDDGFYEEEARYCSEAAVTLSVLSTEMNRVIVEGPFAADYRAEVGEYYYQSILETLKLNSPEVEELKKQKEALNADYHRMLADQGSAAGYTRESAIGFTEVYGQMIDLDKQIAEILGFDSAAEMNYLTYSRDYTPEDAREFCERSKEYFAPLVDLIPLTAYASVPAGYEGTFSAMAGALGAVGPELEEVWDYMMEYELYDYSGTGNRQSGAYTTYLYMYDAPFCFGNWDDTFTSATTVMHEFGHFYNAWIHYDEAVVFNLDVEETYSQGLELLMHERFSDFTNMPQQAQLANLSGFMDAILFQALLEEFQLRAYEMDTLDVDELAKLYNELFSEYGYGAYTGESGYDYSWYRVTHLFDVPFYTISYCTSACVALQIWAEAQEDWRAGADIYLDMIHAEQNQPFTQLVESVGLRSPNDAAVMEEIAGYMAEAFEEGGVGLPAAA